MTQDAIAAKIQRIVSLGAGANEDEVRSLAVLIRKRLELISDRADYSTLNLFCTWAVHTEITASLPGLRTIARVHDALIYGGYAGETIHKRVITEAIGFNALRSELIACLDEQDIVHQFHDESVWVAFIEHLIEIIRDVPIAFPPIGELQQSTSRMARRVLKIYEQIEARASAYYQSPIVSISLSDVDFRELAIITDGTKTSGNIRCLVIRTEDQMDIAVPLENRFLT